MKKKAIFILSILFIFGISAFSISVSPMVIEIEARPGDTIEDDLLIVAEEQGGPLALNVFKPVQTSDGALDYLSIEQCEQGDTPYWFTIDPEILLAPYQYITVPFSIKVPFTAKGTNVAAIMLEPDSIQAAQSLKVKVRFAILIIIRVQTSGLRETYNIKDFGFTPDEDGQPSMAVTFENDSLTDYFTNIDASIRDSDGKPVERVRLITKQSEAMGNISTWLLPGSEIVFKKELSNIFSPGDYKVHLFINFGGRQRIVSSVLTIEKEKYNFPEQEELYMIFDKPNISLSLMPRSVKTQVIEVTNKGSEAVDIIIQPAEVRENYKRSLLDWVSFRGTPNFNLKPERSNRMAITFSIPEGTEPGGYYGKLVYTASKDATPLVSKEVILGVTVGEPTLAATFLDIATEVGESESLITLLIKNTCNIHFENLKGTFRLINMNLGIQVAAGSLEPSRSNWVFPADTVSMFGNIIKKIEPANYLLEYEIWEGNKNIIRSSAMFVIEAEPQLAYYNNF